MIRLAMYVGAWALAVVTMRVAMLVLPAENWGITETVGFGLIAGVPLLVVVPLVYVPLFTYLHRSVGPRWRPLILILVGTALSLLPTVIVVGLVGGGFAALAEGETRAFVAGLSGLAPGIAGLMYVFYGTFGLLVAVSYIVVPIGRKQTYQS